MRSLPHIGPHDFAGVVPVCLPGVLCEDESYIHQLGFAHVEIRKVCRSGPCLPPRPPLSLISAIAPPSLPFTHPSSSGLLAGAASTAS